MDKPTIQVQLDKLVNDAAGIQSSINNYQRELEECQQKINSLTQSITRHQGALNYNSILLEFARKQMEEAEKLEKAAQDMKTQQQESTPVIPPIAPVPLSPRTAKFKAIAPQSDGTI